MLIFDGLRWPRAVIAKRERTAIPLSNGTRLPERDYVIIVATGQRGRAWTPEPVDATWRTFAELDLGSEACEDFIRRRGDPYGQLGHSSAQSISTSQWVYLQPALMIATKAWADPDADGVSYPRTDVSGRRFIEHPAAISALTKIKLVPAEDGPQVTAHEATRLDAFMVMRAVQALEEPRPMKRCAQCGFWFEVRREQREPRFCSSSCRALHHQQPETTDGLDT